MIAEPPALYNHRPLLNSNDCVNETGFPVPTKLFRRLCTALNPFVVWCGCAVGHCVFDSKRYSISSGGASVHCAFDRQRYSSGSVITYSPAPHRHNYAPKRPLAAQSPVLTSSLIRILHRLQVFMVVSSTP